MTAQEKVKRDIDTMLESINCNIGDLQKPGLSSEERAGIKQHLIWCQDQLSDLIQQLEAD